ncbi:MerR family transcriptional regulator [Cryptosporangium aurantiacum]|uniref:DNA-binding transcriptional regulator, MerR family n=1 Tax=Cryptosporangium aurantiacum TaxID=134849 RepID=A0A1M7RM15_9ACTN|nr:MerR family transcriptional regulator [Cryptosporangium aurantiacum]SHN47166.1 DNA-binding transcriptional regulator, MerR family [Cryptosporangium aurantiacum]
MDDLYSIGDLAHHTGLSVRTIRFYSDAGVTPPTARSPAGHRRYDATALGRLDLVRTLRDLGLDLATIQRVLQRHVSLADVAAAHADALAVQIQTLRVQHAVLTLIAARGTEPSEAPLMNRLARLSAAERERLVTTFIDETFADLDANPEFVAMMRAALPELPTDPSPSQLDGWVALAELIQNPQFRASARRAAEHQAAERAAGDQTGLHGALTDDVRARVEDAIAAGTDPRSPEAQPVIDGIVARYVAEFGTSDTAAYRAALVTRIEIGGDPHAERYFQLLARVNGVPEMPSLQPVVGWLSAALRAHPEAETRG